MLKFDFSNKLFQFIDVIKKYVFFFFILLVIIKIILYYVNLMILYDLNSDFNSFELITGFMYLVYPFLIILYMNFIKSESLIEIVISLFILFYRVDIYNYFNEKIILIKKYYLFFYEYSNKDYYEFCSGIILSFVLIILLFLLSLFIKLILIKVKIYRLPYFKDNFMKIQRILILLFFVLPFLMFGIFVFIFELFSNFNNFSIKNFMINEFLISFQIPNIIQLYLNIHKSNNQYEKYIGFLIFSINLIISFVYIVFSNNKELPQPNIYFSLYCVFCPIIIALCLKYLLTKQLPMNIGKKKKES